VRELSAAQPVLGERPLGWSANMAVRLPRQRRRSHGGARRRVVAAHHRGTREPRTAARMHPPAPSTAALPPPTAPGKCRAEIPWPYELSTVGWGRSDLTFPPHPAC